MAQLIVAERLLFEAKSIDFHGGTFTDSEGIVHPLMLPEEDLVLYVVEYLGMDTAEHVLRYTAAYVGDRTGLTRVRYIQAGTCSCGTELEAYSVLDATHAAHNLRHAHTRHVERTEGSMTAG